MHPRAERAAFLPGGWSPRRGQIVISAVLFVLTFVSTTTLGAVWWIAAQVGRSTNLDLWLSPTTLRAVWTDSAYLANGLAFSVPLLLILLAHEMGHYLVCRSYRLPANPPYFLPAPIALGTLGAFIKIRSPIRDRRQLFDVGVGGPLAGFAALAPFLLVGVALSKVSEVAAVDASQAEALLFRPGRSLLMQAVVRVAHGPLAPSETVDLHPFALAAWVGLLATSLNLLPLGQLDGGHIVYAVFGRHQRRLALPLWLALALCGLAWPGWLVWCVAIALIGLRHPPVLDEATRLDSGRLRLAAVSAGIFLATFMPVPITTVWVLVR